MLGLFKVTLSLCILLCNLGIRCRLRKQVSILNLTLRVPKLFFMLSILVMRYHRWHANIAVPMYLCSLPIGVFFSFAS